MNKIYAVLVCALSVGGWFVFKPAPSFDLSNYQTIRIGVDAPYPPYEFYDSVGRLTGFEIDLGNEACDFLEVRCEWVVTPWDTIIPDLNAGKFDLIMSSMSINSDRKKEVDFSKPYYSTPSVFFSRIDQSIGGVSNRQLSGRTVVVQRGTLQHEYVLEEYDDSVTVLALDNWSDVRNAFLEGEADVVFTDYPQWEEEFFLARIYEILGGPVNLGDGVGLAFRKGEHDLRTAMNVALDYLKDSGRFLSIRREYFFYEIMVE